MTGTPTRNASAALLALTISAASAVASAQPEITLIGRVHIDTAAGRWGQALSRSASSRSRWG